MCLLVCLSVFPLICLSQIFYNHLLDSAIPVWDSYCVISNFKHTNLPFTVPAFQPPTNLVEVCSTQPMCNPCFQVFDRGRWHNLQYSHEMKYLCTRWSINILSTQWLLSTYQILNSIGWNRWHVWSTSPIIPVHITQVDFFSNLSIPLASHLLLKSPLCKQHLSI